MIAAAARVSVGRAAVTVMDDISCIPLLFYPLIFATSDDYYGVIEKSHWLV